MRASARRSGSPKQGGSRSSQLTNMGSKPSELGSMYTMPHRLTVAGLATARSAGSNIMVISGLRATISPLFRHSFLLSSSTVFMFSIHSASTGPSNTIHVRSSPASRAAARMMVDASPSDHSSVSGSNSPYSSPMVMHLGFSTCMPTRSNRSSSTPSSRSRVMARASTLYTCVLPPIVGPTSVAPNRTLKMSNSWITLAMNLDSRCRPPPSTSCSMARCRSP
mmetsp:Transcript_29793/g.97522  ORF Transcript_29793/g.97522 Transcript_29793/m.97522 type:complete len:222 (-) Transcript_29793:388-1053(-)